MSATKPINDQEGDRFVLMLIGGGIVAIVLAVIITMAVATLPDWAESVFSAIVGGSLVKLADVLSALVTMSTSRQTVRQTERLTNQLAAAPALDAPTGSPDDPVTVQQAKK
ncbi:MAG: hypothetical protein EON59_00545 [Alphaproteobacteria bacterium]|nr:MAG: hypothetical protein EON59_00545 [Alphaproteobacteria bacterium]